MAVEILNTTFNSINTYFDSLALFGYRKQSDVNKLLALIFIEEILTEEMRFFITEEDYRLIERALYCLYGSSCLIPYPEYINIDYLFGRKNFKNIVTRLTEDDNLRSTEDDMLRLLIKTDN